MSFVIIIKKNKSNTRKLAKELNYLFKKFSLEKNYKIK